MVMILRLLIAIGAAVLILSAGPGRAGPCAQDIDRLQAQVDAKIERTADTGRFAREARRAFGLPEPSSGPPPAAQSVPEDAPWVSEAMAALARARAADHTGDRSTCEQALAGVQGAVDR
jgi:hypothetical protein